MILSNPIFVSILSSTLRRICLSGPRGIQASLTQGNHNNHKVGVDCYQRLILGSEMSVKQYLIREATSVSLYMVEYFVEEARKSSHRFPSRWSIRNDGDK